MCGAASGDGGGGKTTLLTCGSTCATVCTAPNGGRVRDHLTTLRAPHALPSLCQHLAFAIKCQICWQDHAVAGPQQPRMEFQSQNADPKSATTWTNTPTLFGCAGMLASRATNICTAHKFGTNFAAWLADTVSRSGVSSSAGVIGGAPYASHVSYACFLLAHSCKKDANK